MKSGIDPKVDYVFKKLFGSEGCKPILIDLLSAVLGEEIADVELLNPFNPQEFEGDKLSILDVKARLRDGRLVNVEMQMWADKSYPNRMLYYWSESYAGQLMESDRYETLRKTIGIHFVDSVLFPETPRHHLSFRLKSDEAPELDLNDQLEIHLFQLPNFKLASDELRTGLDFWCYFLKYGEQMDRDDLPAALKSEPIGQALEVLEVISHNDQERMLYQARARAKRNEASLKFAWEQTGRTNGLSIAVAEAMEEKFGASALPFKERINRIDKEAKLRELIRRLVTDITLEEFVARLDTDE